MPLYQPGTDNLYESGLDNLINAFLKRNAVVTGCQVIAHAAPDMGVRVSAGTVQGGDARVAVVQTDLAIDANPGANNRIDLISINYTTGVATKTTGNPAPAATLHPPALPATDILVAYISVPAAAVNIQNANINDRRIFVPGYEDLQQLIARPNLIPNPDFGRRTVMGLAMPETFTDANGYAVVAGAGAVAGNIFTASAINTELAWCNQAFVWRDGRVSATFKAVAVGGTWQMYWRISATERIYIQQAAGNLYLSKTLAGVGSNVAGPSAQVLTVNRWYWLELEKQGTTIIGKIYDTGGTVPGVAKSASTLLQTLTATVADASVQVGAHVGIYSDQNGAQWGGIAASPGGVYVETWLPEGVTFTFQGTLGGQALGYDEAVDAGPLSKQWALRGYIPAVSRTIFGSFSTGVSGVDVPAIASTGYTYSAYAKAAGYGGANSLVYIECPDYDTANGNFHGNGALQWTNEAAYTRKSISSSTAATARKFIMDFYFNLSGTATGTAWLSCIQLEQGFVATAWRPSPSQPFTYNLVNTSGDKSTTSAAMVEVDPRDSAVNIFLPEDATVEIKVMGEWLNSAVGNNNQLAIYVDGAAQPGTTVTRLTAPGNSYSVGLYASVVVKLAAGKHRVAVQYLAGAGTATIRASTTVPLQLNITASRGK